MTRARRGPPAYRSIRAPRSCITSTRRATKTGRQGLHGNGGIEPGAAVFLLGEGMMDIKKRDFLLAGAGVMAAGAAGAQTPSRMPIPVRSNEEIHPHTQPSSMDPNYKPRRINKAIELWE